MIICWFGIYNPDFGRNKIYIQALKKAGHMIIECRDNSRGLMKYFYLWKKHRRIKNDYDVMIIGYPGHVVVPLAKLISKKKVIADLLGSLYDAEVNSHYPNFGKKLKARFVDFVAVKFADKILLESESQKKFFEGKFGKSGKYEVVYTGADEEFSPKSIKFLKSEKGKDEFVVLFRGKLTPESGIMHILKAAELLKKNNKIRFKIIGVGYFLEKVMDFISEKNLTNVELVSQFLSVKELIEQIGKADLMLGQFGDNPRLSRAIPHKVFEALALGIIYLTGEGLAIKEIVEDETSALFVPLADPGALAGKIEFLSTQTKLFEQIATRARKIFEEKFTSAALVEKLVKAML